MLVYYCKTGSESSNNPLILKVLLDSLLANSEVKL